MSTTSRRFGRLQPLFQRSIVLLVIASLELGMLSPAWAVPSQKPLLSSSGAMPNPNVMLTVDTSGSMNFRHMPEGSTYINGRNITVQAGESWIHHADDSYYDFAGTGNFGGVMRGVTGGKDVDEQLKLRSPDVNSIYYNPEVLYKPWATAAGGRMPAAKIDAAYIDPLKQATNSARINLTVNGYRCYPKNRGNCTNFEALNPGLYYRLKNTTVNPDQASSYTEYNINASSTTTYPKYADRTDCVGSTTCTRTEERQNFANWFVYYRTRMLLTKAALSESFYNMGEVARVGWTTIKYAFDNPSSEGSPRAPVINGVQSLTTAHRTNLINAIQSSAAFNADGGTPLRIALDQVGKYFQDASNRGPWSDNPVSASSEKLLCRRSYNILTTDGYYNDNVSGSAVGDLDGKITAKYTKIESPYRDKPGTGYSNTLADYALKYWATDLLPNSKADKETEDKEDKVVPTNKDPATWQHLTQFTVGMGVKGTLDHEDPKVLQQLTDGGIVWPDPATSDRAKIDDLWHAAVNSRGTFYSVRSSNELADALKNAIGQAVGQRLTEGGIATASGSLQEGNLKFLPEYRSGSWTGEFSAYSLNGLGAKTDTPVWQASKRLPKASDRVIKIYDGANTVDFTFSTMGAANKTAFTNGSADLVDYLRGETKNEGDSGLRVRGGPLADFVNSSPSYVQGNVNLGYGDLPTGGSGYASFLGTKAARTPIIYLGGNGGFLHGFNATADEKEGGKEVFAFVPRGVLGNLSKLASQNYGVSGGANEHQYFVDGPMVESDFYDGNWKNMLVGTLGAGGKGLYALNLPLTGAGTPTALWDLTTGGGADMGYIFARPQVGVLPNGSWKVFVGNGIDSTSGKAALLIIDVLTGAITTLTVDAGSGNGLGGVTLVRNTKREVIGAYAGDLKGQLWRFDINSANTALQIGYSSRPLFTAKDATGTVQPITAAPTLLANPSGGSVVLFGTGKLTEASDKSSTQIQSVYGVYDKFATNQSTVSTTSPFTTSNNRSALVQQVISAASISKFYNVTSKPQGSEPLGWYMDLSIPGGDKPKMLYTIQTMNAFAFINAVQPAGAAGVCQSLESKAYAFLLPGLTGAQYPKPVFDTNGDGKINSSDSASAGIDILGSGEEAILEGSTQAASDGTTLDTLCSRQNVGGGVLCMTYKPLPPSVAPKLKDRIYRRLLNPPLPAAQ